MCTRNVHVCRNFAICQAMLCHAMPPICMKKTSFSSFTHTNACCYHSILPKFNLYFPVLYIYNFLSCIRVVRREGSVFIVSYTHLPHEKSIYNEKAAWKLRVRGIKKMKKRIFFGGKMMKIFEARVFMWNVCSLFRYERNIGMLVREREIPSKQEKQAKKVDLCVHKRWRPTCWYYSYFLVQFLSSCALLCALFCLLLLLKSSFGGKERNGKEKTKKC